VPLLGVVIGIQRKATGSTMTRRSRGNFGGIRKLPSGNFQARYTAPDGKKYTAPTTFTTVTDARTYLATVQADLVRQTWRAPVRSGIKLNEYGEKWIRERPLKDSSRARYWQVWGAYIAPRIGNLELEEVTPDVVRTWYYELGDALRDRAPGPGNGRSKRRSGGGTLAITYRLLRAILNTAIEDEIIMANPCKIKGGGTHIADERPTLSIEEVEEIAAEVPDRYKALVLVLAWSAIRIGEACELRRSNVDFSNGSLRIVSNVYPVDGKGYVVETPKSSAGSRSIAMPRFVMDELEIHISTYCQDDPDDLVFITRSHRVAYGAAQTAITRAMRRMGIRDFRVHDLRHTGQTFAASNGATVADLKSRLGHSTWNAAMHYAHASSDNDRKVADKMGDQRASVVRTRNTKPAKKKSTN